MQKKINLGIIGKNFGYNVIYKSFKKNKKFEIKGFSFRSKNKIKIPKKIKIYNDWRKIILDKNISAIAIAAPPKLHKNIIKFAVKNNKHIFCEKPLTTSFEEANILCNLIQKQKKICNIVNYEFSEIPAFVFFKKKILKNIKINKVYINWNINMKKRSKKNWKEKQSSGGGIMFNYACHAIYYLENMFGKINWIKSKIFSFNDIKTLESNIYLKNGIIVKLNMEIGKIIRKTEPIHQIKIISKDKTYLLRSKLESLSDQFQLIELKKNLRKTLFKSKGTAKDFRINPTFENSKKFSDWILRDIKQTPNFLDAKRVHFIIKKMIFSSNTRKKVYIN